MGTTRVDWVKMRIIKLQFLILLIRSGLYRMVALKSLVGQSCSALNDILTSIHGAFVRGAYELACYTFEQMWTWLM